MISTDYNTLVDQASGTIEAYFGEAVRAIDLKFGNGYAKNNPDLVAAFIKAAAADYNNAAMIVAIQEASSEVSGALHSVAESLREE